eukprot:3210224-Pyramimonas_sp.AAC.1
MAPETTATDASGQCHRCTNAHIYIYRDVYMCVHLVWSCLTLTPKCCSPPQSGKRTKARNMGAERGSGAALDPPAN